MVRRGKVVVVLALVVSLGAHWALLQSVAWVGMIVTYAQEATLAEAVRMTFDGEHPCRLCKVIKAGRATDKKQDAKGQADSRLEPALLPSLVDFLFTSDPPGIPVGDTHGMVRRDAPPKPRPRLLPPGELA